MSDVGRLEVLWSGPLFRLRAGELSAADVDEVLSVIRAVGVGDADQVVDRRLVSLLWYLPLFVGWQSERVSERGGDSVLFARLLDGVTTEVERILGVP